VGTKIKMIFRNTKKSPPTPPETLLMNEKLHKKVSPPFEGGVDGSADNLVFTKLYFPAGVVDSMIS